VTPRPPNLKPCGGWTVFIEALAAKKKATEERGDVMDLCRSKATGKMFRPSYPDDWDDADAIAACIIGRIEFYFCGVSWQPRKWWQFHGRWVDTGEIWKPSSGEFDVIDSNSPLIRS